jgi:glycosyltransferase involved in cell wall biosynthesis
VVPARDEAEFIEPCLRSVLAALDVAAIDGWIVVVADRCANDTADRARALVGDRGAVRVTDRGNVGAARRVGCDEAIRHFAALADAHAREKLWLLSTDADSVVPTDWITTHLAEAARGATAVAGTVAVASFAGRARHLRPRFEREYRVTAGGSHPHLHGTNIGIRADVYASVGGWASLATGEDHDLWSRLSAAGHPVVATTQAPVVTSSRHCGRAPQGFAAYLDRLEALPAAVPS